MVSSLVLGFFATLFIVVKAHNIIKKASPRAVLGSAIVDCDNYLGDIEILKVVINDFTSDVNIMSTS
jgi:hypothetical protein